MQALQKAAKEREDVIGPAARTGVLESALALEPLDLDRVSQQATAGSKSPGIATGATPAQAATVIQASDRGPGWIDWAREHRKQLYGALIGLAIFGYSVYFYLSVFHPTLLRRTFSSPAVTVAPPPAPAAPAAKPAPRIETGALAAPGSAASAQVAEEAVSASVAPARKALARQPEAMPPTPAPRLAARRPTATDDPAARQPKGGIAVKPGGEAPPLNPQLSRAYDALRAGRLDEAVHLYEGVLKSEPRNVDALLGRAAIAQQQGNADLATRYLFQVLQVDPSNTLAQGGLINLLGSADPQSAESKLKSLIAKDPSAFLYFSLGNLYADQGNWPAAQAAYFQAHHLARANPDYAFNLAVSLEHLSQPKLALNFYRQALELAGVAGRANFDPEAVRDRITKLASSGE